MGIEKLKQKVMKKIKPSAKEVRQELAFAKKLIEKIRRLEGKHVDVQLAGSLARNTHLKGDRDIDIFVLFPREMPREQFEKEGLRIGKIIFGKNKWEEAYTEHPYVRGEIGKYEVEIVPSYKVEAAELLQSAVDRSPFHNEYLLGKLDERLRNEIRLLRQFLKGIKCYGADLKVSSVPGYVVELLILNYGSFEEVIKNVARWASREIIDVEGLYQDKSELLRKFIEPLVVVDPVDKNRNVAAALSHNQYSRFIVAARAFLKKPSINFFFGKRLKPFNAKKLKEIFSKTEFVGIEIAYPKGVISDIVWGQLRKIRKKIANEMHHHEFGVLRGGDWTDEKKTMVLIYELESRELQKAQKRIGPAVTNEKASEDFLKAHPKPLSGPRVEDGRWVIEIERKYTRVEDLLKDYLKELKAHEKEGIKKGLEKRAKILGEKDILKFYRTHKGFQEFFTEYILGEEVFLLY